MESRSSKTRSVGSGELPFQEDREAGDTYLILVGKQPGDIICKSDYPNTTRVFVEFLALGRRNHLGINGLGHIRPIDDANSQFEVVTIPWQNR